MAILLVWVFSNLNVYADTLREFNEFKIGAGEIVSKWPFRKCRRLELVQKLIGLESEELKRNKYLRWKIRRLEVDCMFEISKARSKIMSLYSTDPYAITESNLQMGDNTILTQGNQLLAESTCDRFLQSR